MVRSLALSLVVSLLAGCVYMKSSVDLKAHGVYENYPTSLEADRERRAKRRKYALIAAPIEIAIGAALGAAAIYGKSEPSMSDTTSGALADAGKDVLGRMLLVMAGGALAISGVGDGVLGAVAPLMPNSLVRDGALVPADQIDKLPPPTTIRPTLEDAVQLGARGAGGNLALGVSRWMTPTVRLNGSAVGEFVAPWHTADMRGSLYGQVEIERAFGREYLGVYPRSSIGLYGIWGGTGQQDRDHASGPIVGGGVSLRLRYATYRAGVTYIPGIDTHPMFVFQGGSALRFE